MRQWLIVWVVVSLVIGGGVVVAQTGQGDADGNGVVNLADVTGVLTRWLQGLTNTFDQYQNGKINSLDFAVVARVLVSSGSPTPTPVATTFVQVDPGSDTDNYVNNFILSQIQPGNPQSRRIAASGAWWGPVSKFFENQIWIVNKSIFADRKVYTTETHVEQTFTCLMPGRSGGSAANTLTTPYLRFQIGGNADVRFDSSDGNVFEEFHTLRIPRENSGSQELRTDCIAFENVTNNFGDGSATRNDRIQVNLDQQVWFGSMGNPGTGTANHDGVPLRFDIVDTHIWYEHIEYAYGHLDGADVPGRGLVSPYQLIGSTVNGTVTFYTFAYKTGNTGRSPLHHLELRVEQGGEDYTVQRHFSTPSGTPLPFGKNTRHAFQLDTTRLTDGWHIVSWHYHVIDHTGNPSYDGRQFAGELKFPVCVNNTNQGLCP